MEQSSLNGGFLSIGHECSISNTCGRLLRQGDYEAWGECLRNHDPDLQN